MFFFNDEQPRFHLFYRREGDADYIAALVRELEQEASSGPLLVILTGEERTAPGQLVVLGPQADMVATVGKE
jgi:hypothetical protein